MRSVDDGICFLDLCCNDPTGTFTGRLYGVDIHRNGRTVGFRYPLEQGVYTEFGETWFRVASRTFSFIPGTGVHCENAHWSRVAIRVTCARSLIQYIRTRGFRLDMRESIPEFAEVLEAFKRCAS